MPLNLTVEAHGVVDWASYFPSPGIGPNVSYEEDGLE